MDRIFRKDDRYVVSVGDGQFEADNVIVATGAHQEPRIPAFSRQLDPGIGQLHSSEYRNPSQLRDGPFSGLPILSGGRSAGARVACRTAAETGAASLLRS